MRHRLQEVAVALLVLTVCQCSARSSNSKSSATPRTVYDQKQTGDYNIQLHLKDFQVIALLGGEGSALGVSFTIILSKSQTDFSLSLADYGYILI